MNLDEKDTLSGRPLHELEMFSLRPGMYGSTRVFLSSSPAATSTYQYPEVRSRVENREKPLSASSVASIRGEGYASRCVTLFNLR